MRIELDVVGERQVPSAKLDGKPDRGDIEKVQARTLRLSNLFSKAQQRLVAEGLPSATALDDLTVLGPVDALKWELPPETFPDGERGSARPAQPLSVPVGVLWAGRAGGWEWGDGANEGNPADGTLLDTPSNARRAGVLARTVALDDVRVSGVRDAVLSRCPADARVSRSPGWHAQSSSDPTVPEAQARASAFAAEAAARPRLVRPRSADRPWR